MKLLGSDLCLWIPWDVKLDEFKAEEEGPLVGLPRSS